MAENPSNPPNPPKEENSCHPKNPKNSRIDKRIGFEGLAHHDEDSTVLKVFSQNTRPGSGAEDKEQINKVHAPASNKDSPPQTKQEVVTSTGNKDNPYEAIPENCEEIDQHPQVQTFGAKYSDFKLTEPKFTPEDMDISSNGTTGGEKNENISPEIMLQYVQRGDSVVCTTPCAAFISGVRGCGKMESAFDFFSKAINAYGIKNLTPHLEESREGKKDCLLFYRLILAGDSKQLVWMNFESTDVTAMFLLSYFVDHCKVRNCELHFTTQPSTPGSNPFEETVYEMHGRVKQLWDKFPKSKKEIFSTGVTLVNAYGIGPSQAAQDFVSFLNKYCRRSIHLTCYSDTLDDANLGGELDSRRPYFKNLKCSQMFRQLKGCINEEQKVVVTRLENGDTPGPDTCSDKLKKEIKARVHTEYVNEVKISNNKDKTEKARKFIEELVIKSSFHCTLYLKEFVLFQTIKTESKANNSFWMKKSDIEELSKQCKMVNGTLQRFLKVFTSFGKVFYAHNIPALDEFVITDIVKFVEYLHTIYASREDEQFSQYGLSHTSMETRIEK